MKNVNIQWDKTKKNQVILNSTADLQRLPLQLVNSLRGRSRIKYGMTALYNNGGFTLIEFLVVVLIIGILAAVAVPQYQKVVEKSRATQALTLLKSIVQAQKAYYLANDQYATKLEQLDVAMSGWTGNEQWIYNANMVAKSNKEWSLQLFNKGGNYGHAVFVGRISGPYAGAGFQYWFIRPIKDLPSDTIICQERDADGVIFDGADGDYCHKIMGGTKYNNVARQYTLPY